MHNRVVQCRIACNWEQTLHDQVNLSLAVEFVLVCRISTVEPLVGSRQITTFLFMTDDRLYANDACQVGGGWTNKILRLRVVCDLDILRDPRHFDRTSGMAFNVIDKVPLVSSKLNLMTSHIQIQTDSLAACVLGHYRN